MEEARPKWTTCLSFQLFYRKAFIPRQFSKHSWSFHSKAFKERLKDYIDSKTQWVSNSFLISITYGWSFPCAISMIAIACKRGKIQLIQTALVYEICSSGIPKSQKPLTGFCPLKCTPLKTAHLIVSIKPYSIHRTFDPKRSLSSFERHRKAKS